MTPQILVIDDDPVTSKLVTLLLQREKYGVIAARSAAAGLRVLNEIRPNLVILDIMMPGIDGYEFCRLVRQEYTSEELPILMFSALGRPSDQRKGFELGADDYLVKPVNSRDLIDRVRSMLFFAVNA